MKGNTFFQVIPYIHSPMMGLFPQISNATMTMFLGGSLVKKINWTRYHADEEFSRLLNRREKFWSAWYLAQSSQV